MKFMNELRNIVSRLPSAELVGDVNLALPLKDLVYSRAYFSTFISEISREIADSFPIADFHMESFVVFFLFWMFLTVANKPNEGVVYRLGHAIEYTHVRKNVSRLLFVVYIIFCKNLDNAI
jgi:hypothetical protein